MTFSNGKYYSKDIESESPVAYNNRVIFFKNAQRYLSCTF